jgi:hypothetical protein
VKAGQEPVHLATVWGAGAQLAETLASFRLATAFPPLVQPRLLFLGGGLLRGVGVEGGGWCGWLEMMGTLLGPERTTE